MELLHSLTRQFRGQAKDRKKDTRGNGKRLEKLWSRHWELVLTALMALIVGAFIAMFSR
jgi:hypothetical protein